MNTRELIQHLIQIPSQTHAEAEIGEFLFGYLAGEGVRVHHQQVSETRWNVIAQKGTGQQKILLAGHMDTVGITEGWTKVPLGTDAEGDRVYGLGAFDMKGGLAALMRAFERYTPQHTTLQFLGTVDEENVSAGCETYLASNFSNNVACAVVTEPAFIHPLQGIAVGRSGRLLMQLTLTRPSCHFFAYQTQKDLGLLLARIMEQLQTLFLHDDHKRQFLFIRNIAGDSNGMSLPDKITVEIDCCVVPPETGHSLYARAQNLVAQCVAQCDPTVQASLIFDPQKTQYLAPYEISTSNVFYTLLADAVQEATGNPAIPYFRPSVADENIFAAQGMPVFGIGPEGGHAHGPDEWVSVSSVERLTDIIETFIRRVDTHIGNTQRT